MQWSNGTLADVSRGYRQFCGLARALDLDRRTLGAADRSRPADGSEALLRPARRACPEFRPTCLRPACASSRRRASCSGAPHARPGGGVVYDLTDFGRELEQPVLRLGFWGAKAMGARHDGDYVSIGLTGAGTAWRLPPRARRGPGTALRVQGRGQVAPGGCRSRQGRRAVRIDRRAGSRGRDRRRRARRGAERPDRPRDGTEVRPDEARGYARQRHADCSRCSGFLPHRTDRQGPNGAGSRLSLRAWGYGNSRPSDTTGPVPGSRSPTSLRLATSGGAPVTATSNWSSSRPT